MGKPRQDVPAMDSWDLVVSDEQLDILSRLGDDVSGRAGRRGPSTELRQDIPAFVLWDLIVSNEVLNVLLCLGKDVIELRWLGSLFDNNKLITWRRATGSLTSSLLGAGHLLWKTFGICTSIGHSSTGGALLSRDSKYPAVCRLWPLNPSLHRHE